MHDTTLPGAGRPASIPVPQLRAALNGRVIAPGYDQAGPRVDLSWTRLAIDLATVAPVLLAAFVSAVWEGRTSPEECQPHRRRGQVPLGGRLSERRGARGRARARHPRP